ncbi:MAG: HRDC domain-containing protein [Desulfobacterales bacterium]
MINNAVLKSVAAAYPKTHDEITAISALKNWQKEALGDDIVAALDAWGDGA